MPTVTVSLVGAADPQFAQVVVSGLTSGDVYEVRGRAADVDFEWRVRGGVGTSTGAQVVLADATSPVNTPVTYRVLVDGLTVATSGPVTVDYAGEYVLQSLDGHSSARVTVIEDAFARDPALRVAAFTIPGRSAPVTMYDRVAGVSASLRVMTEGAQTAALRDLIHRGAPMLFRTDGALLDAPAVEFIHVASAPSSLISGSTARVWDLGFTVIADPEPNTLVASSTWAHFDAAFTGLTWADFDAQWAGADWSDFDRYDWAAQGES